MEGTAPHARHRQVLLLATQQPALQLQRHHLRYCCCCYCCCWQQHWRGLPCCLCRLQMLPSPPLLLLNGLQRVSLLLPLLPVCI
jgi:hypothetical protein